MVVINSHKDIEALTLTFEAEFGAPVERVWRVWSDPRRLERWWGPPGWPATFERHDFTVGGRSAYYMSGPEGEKYHGWWKITALTPPTGLEFEDGFADDAGQPIEAMGATRTSVTLSPAGGGTRVVSVTTFASVEQLEKLSEMGIEDGLRRAMGQIEAVLADD
ncbi:SRPBCC domain-containing protein [Actinokineospora auranticolor]|uniref:Uncharacterized protein YndB with AHSA1/START domain n=1 Tax=Actinokineospora auranticolor TaxID=155976 RepID=A0A2S6H0T3_9PSEU|nr:SRPBCC domain-containing protein [Actinokineospora auranticolor]PPK71093.1 uncharacterized protein YndB with AHSA1/START domain [Actinokineospora auranticolor]